MFFFFKKPQKTEVPAAQTLQQGNRKRAKKKYLDTCNPMPGSLKRLALLIMLTEVYLDADRLKELQESVERKGN